MLALEFVVRGRGVAIVGRCPEIVVRQAEVGFVRVLLRIAELHAQALVNGTARVTVDLQLGNVILEVVARVAADRPLDRLEAVAAGLHGLEQPRHALTAVAGIQVSVGRAVLADANVGHHAHGVGNRGRDHVDCAAGRARADRDGRRTLEDFEGVHAPLGREVVRRRCGVGCRRNEDAVFEQCDAGATIEPGTADADVRTKPESFLFLQVDTRHRSQRTQDVGRVEDFEFLAVDLVRGTGDIGDIGLATEYRDGVDCLAGPVLSRSRGKRQHQRREENCAADSAGYVAIHQLPRRALCYAMFRR